MSMTALNRFPITAAQVKKIHALKSVLLLGDDDYRTWLAATYNVTSCKEFDQAAAGNAIERLEAIAVKAGVWEPKAARENRYSDLDKRRGGADMASAAQLRMIESVWREVSRAEDPDARRKALRHFIERIAKVSDLRFLDSAGASKVINALTAMQKKSTDTQKPKTPKKAV